MELTEEMKASAWKKFYEVAHGAVSPKALFASCEAVNDIAYAEGRLAGIKEALMEVHVGDADWPKSPTTIPITHLCANDISALLQRRLTSLTAQPEPRVEALCSHALQLGFKLSPIKAQEILLKVDQWCADVARIDAVAKEKP